MPPTPDTDIAFHPFADGGALHRIGSHRLWVLNVTAATLWCLLDGRRDVRELAGAYRRRFGIDDAAARQDVDLLLGRFSEGGLLKGNAPADDRITGGARPLKPLEMFHRLDADTYGLPQMAFSLAGRCFVLTAEENLSEVWRPIFRHLAVERSLEDACTEWALIRKENGGDAPYFCREANGRAEGGLARQEVAPYLVYKLFDSCMAALDNRLLFHAAVAARGGRALLLPAQSGSGKSTLAAALSASGWTCLSDELAVVDPESLAVEPFALPIGLKDKSMTALAQFIPGVADLPRHTRMDGIGVRYLPPPNPPGATPLPVAALVFPSHRRDITAALTPQPPLEALRLLAETGSSARPLVARDVRATLQLASLPSYTLTFSELDQALEQLERIDSGVKL